MSSSDALASCKKLHTDPEQGPEQQFYALVLTNPQHRTFDINVTDGVNAWSGTGLKVTKPPGFTEEEAWKRAKELLTDINPSAKPAALAATELPTGEIQFSWRWEREVGAGRHVMKLPAHTTTTIAAAAAGGGAAGLQSHQQPGVLVKQQPPHTTITHILDTLVTSYSKMQASLSVCGSSQSSLSASLEVIRGQLDSQAAAHKERERELYLKFTMLLNQKTRQLHKEHELVKQLSAEVERLKGAADADTDDEAREAADAADAADEAAAAAAGDDTDSDPDPGGTHTLPGGSRGAAAAAAGSNHRLPTPAATVPGGSAAAAADTAAAGGSSRGVEGVISESEGAEGTAGLGLGQPAAAGTAGAQPMDVDLAATQLLPESQLEEFISQRVNRQQ